TTMAATLSRTLVSLAEAADVLAVSTKTVRRYIADGHLDAVRLGRKTLRIKLDSVERQPAANDAESLHAKGERPLNLRCRCAGSFPRRSPGWTRTNNLPVNSRLLCQLGYRGPSAPRRSEARLYHPSDCLPRGRHRPHPGLVTQLGPGPDHRRDQ